MPLAMVCLGRAVGRDKARNEQNEGRRNEKRPAHRSFPLVGDVRGIDRIALWMDF